jgi:hypothetical protein
MLTQTAVLAAKHDCLLEDLASPLTKRRVAENHIGRAVAAPATYREKRPQDTAHLAGAGGLKATRPP